MICIGSYEYLLKIVDKISSSLANIVKSQMIILESIRRGSDV